LPEHYGYFTINTQAVETLQTIALFAAIFLWVLGFWFFCVTVVAVLLDVRKMCFHLVWWSFVFPNVGFTIATIKIGQQLQSEGILWVASAMTILLVAMWMFVVGSQIRAMWRQDIMMPGKDEDKGIINEQFSIREVNNKMADSVQNVLRTTTRSTALPHRIEEVWTPAWDDRTYEGGADR
jgi:predicted permease